MLLRGWRTWRAKVSLLAPFFRTGRESFFARELHYTDFPQSAQPDWPEVPPYDALADVWHAYSRYSQPD